MKNEWGQINEQITLRTQKQQEELIAKIAEAYYHREDYCNHLIVQRLVLPIGFKCRMLDGNAKLLQPSEVDTMCSKHCHKCPEYTDYIEPVRTIIDELSED